MIYIYYSNNYLEAYEKAYEFGKNINKNIIIINDTLNFVNNII